MNKQLNYECIYIVIYMYTPKLSRLVWEETPGLGLGGNKVWHTCTGRMYIGLYMGLTYLHVNVLESIHTISMGNLLVNKIMIIVPIIIGNQEITYSR